MEEEIKGTKDNKSVIHPSPDSSLHQHGKTHPVTVVKVSITLHVAILLVVSHAI